MRSARLEFGPFSLWYARHPGDSHLEVSNGRSRPRYCRRTPGWTKPGTCFLRNKWSEREDSNLRPLRPEREVLGFLAWEFRGTTFSPVPVPFGTCSRLFLRETPP